MKFLWAVDTPVGFVPDGIVPDDFTANKFRWIRAEQINPPTDILTISDEFRSGIPSILTKAALPKSFDGYVQLHLDTLPPHYKMLNKWGNFVVEHPTVTSSDRKMWNNNVWRWWNDMIQGFKAALPYAKVSVYNLPARGSVSNPLADRYGVDNDLLFLYDQLEFVCVNCDAPMVYPDWSEEEMESFYKQLFVRAKRMMPRKKLFAVQNIRTLLGLQDLRATMRTAREAEVDYYVIQGEADAYSPCEFKAWIKYALAVAAEDCYR